MLIKSSTMPLWTDAPVVAPYSYTMGWDISPTVGTPAATSSIWPIMPDAKGAGGGSFSADVRNGLEVIGSNPPPGGYPIVGELDLKAYIYLPKGARVLITAFGPSVPDSGANLTLEQAELGGTIASENYALNVGAGATASYKGYFREFTIPKSFFARPLSLSINRAWYGFTLNITVMNKVPIMNASTGNMTLTWSPTEPSIPLMVPAIKPPALDISAIPFSNTRVTALAALFTNVTKALNKEGTVMAGRFNPATLDALDLTMADYSQLAPCEKYFFGLEKGFYTYIPLQTDVGEFADDVWDAPQISVTGGVRIPWLHLGRTALVNTFRFDDPDGGTSLAVNLDWHVEYRNSSVLWPVAVSALSLEEAHRAQLVCLEAGFFFDNVDHKFILSMVSKGLGMVAPMLKNRAPAIASAGMAARGYIRSYLGESSHPKPSSLQVATAPRVKVRHPKDKKAKAAPRKPKSDKKKKKK